MGASNALHHATVTHGQPLAIHMLQATDIGSAILGNGNARVAVQLTRHTRGPEHLIPKIALNEAMGIPERIEHPSRGIEHRGNQLQQSFGVIRGDTGMSQCGTQRAGVRSLCDKAVAIDPQAFFLNAFSKSGPLVGRELLKKLMAGFTHE